MKLLACALFFVAWATFCHALVVPQDCNDARIEKEAEVTLDLINKCRKEGYVFSLFRVADAHVQHLKNGSITFLTLDVLETPCPVISRKHWSSCESRPFLSITDLGQCKAVVFINEFSGEKLLHAYNCTVSPVPPKIYECKRCPVRVTVPEDPEKYTGEANRILEKYRLGSNESNYFKVEKVLKVFKAVAERTLFIVEFTIKETTCPRNRDPASVSQCEFLPDGEANQGFCIGKRLLQTGAPDVVEVDSCTIYDIQTHDSEEGHHHCNVTGHECRHPLRKHQRRHPRHHPRHPHQLRHRHHHNDTHHQGHLHEDRNPQIIGHNQTGQAGPRDNRKPEQTQEGRPGIPPPPGPQYPPPPLGGPHHFPPSKYPPPPLGAPPPRPFLRWPGDRHQQSLSSTDFVHHVTIFSEHDVLQAPGANFPDRVSPIKRGDFRNIIQPFPEVSSRSKSCPGKPKVDLLLDILSIS
ncbi:histidine-rich glycoprotein [Erythrolamprus reginae]|uniref:histidine-rich glycoprotein n=1 Tax=Erythrolamprus reginae TaxID=121349 RepID=UPI00396C87A5